MSDVEIKISDSIAPSIAKKLAQIKSTAREADTEVDRLKATLASVSASNAFRKDISEAEKLKNTLREASNVSVSYYGQVSRLNTAIDHQGRSFANATRQVNTNTAALIRNSAQARVNTAAMGQLVSLLTTYAGVRAFAETANAAQQLNNQLRTITNSQAEFNQLQEDLFGLANRTRTGVEDTTRLYVNFYKVLQSVGIGQTELFRMVETLNKGFQVGGKSAQEAAGSTRQFIQALQSGVLRGEEFNSIMEGMPIEILNNLAQAAGVSIDKLRGMAEQGALTRDVLRKGLSGAAEEIDRLFLRTTPTINNAFTLMRNNAIKFFTESSLAGDALVRVISFLADNMNVVIPLIALFGAAWAAVQLASITASIVALGAAIAPVTLAILAWVAAVFTVTAGLYSLGYIMAYVTGQGEAYEAWVAGAIANTIKWAGSIGEAAIKQLELIKLTPDQEALAAAYGKTALSAEELRASIQGIMGGNTTMELTAAANQATTAVKGTAAATKLAAGELRSLSGQASGVYNVQAALAATSTAAGSVGTSAGFAVNELKSLSGQASGVYRITSALDSVTSALKANAHMFVQAANRAKEYAQAAARAAQAAKYIAGAGSPSFQQIGITNTGPNSSIQNLGFATGGSFTVGGKAGRDTNPVSFMATKGEKVTVQTKSQQRAQKEQGRGDRNVTVNLTINATDVDSFRRSQRQVSSDLSRIVGGVE